MDEFALTVAFILANGSIAAMFAGQGAARIHPAGTGTPATMSGTLTCRF